MEDPKQTNTTPETPPGVIKTELPKAQVSPEKPKRKPRSDKGKPRKPGAPSITKQDFEIPLAIIIMDFSESLAINRGEIAYKMTDKEAQAIERGFNIWVERRLPLLEKFYPEVCLLTPIASYLMRVRGDLRRAQSLKSKTKPKEEPTKETQ